MKKIKYGGSMCGQEEYLAITNSAKNSIKTGNWQTGKEAERFEKEMAKYLGVKHAVFTSSGSAAGLLALSALELPAGSEVLIPATTFPTIFNIILQSNLVPVVVDCKISTNNIDLDKLEEAITPDTKAIIAVHAVGNPVDMPRLMKIARKYKLKVIEDDCDGFGGTIGKKKVGSFGDISITSTHAAHIITTGVGGLVFTNDKKLATKVRQYKDWGRQAGRKHFKGIPKSYNPCFVYDKIGYNFQPLELQAAMGRVQLRKIEEIKKKRKRNTSYLKYYLSKHERLRFIEPIENSDPCWFSFPIITFGNRAKLIKHLEKKGIETRPLFTGNITRQPAQRDTYYRIGNKLTGADFIMEQSFWISCHPSLTQDDLDYIIKTFDDYYGKK